MDKIEKLLMKLCDRECWCDDPRFNSFDYSGGNYDDAYAGGFDDGQTKLARELIALIKRK